MKHDLRGITCIVVVLAIAQLALAADGDKLLFGFENEQDLRAWDFRERSAQLSDQHVTQGSRSLRIDSGDLMNMSRPADWSGFESLDMDVFVEGDRPVNVSIVVGDKAWQEKPTYWNRHNSGMVLRPGANTISIPVTGMYRGEQGSRNNDIKTNIDPSQIVRFYVEFGGRSQSQQPIYIDNIRLVKSTRPDDVLAFDLGPDSQTIFPGFTPIGPSTVYGQNGNTAGLRAPVNPNWARDSTFPTRLYQDFIGMEGTSFIVDVPNGKYNVWVVYEDLGYWGGETARFEQRTISANGRVVDVDNRGPAGLNDYLYRFEKIEPKPGDNLWELYVQHLFVPRQFEVTVDNGRLELAFEAGGPFLNTKVAGIILYPAGSQQAANWVAEVEKKNREEFESRAVFMGPLPKELTVPESAKAQGYWLGFPSLDQTITFTDAPGVSDGKMQRTAAQGQSVSMTFAIRPLRDFPQVELSASDLAGPNGTIPSANVDLRYVHHATQRGFNSIAYQIVPETLRPVSGSDLQLPAELTRQFWITVNVPADAPAGAYTGQIALKAGELNLTLPISVEVLPIKLDEPDFAMGFYGVHVPPEASFERNEGYRRLLKILKDNGMNSFTGGPNLQFRGLDQSGKPIIEGYEEVDAFMAIARELGYRHPISAYGGPGMVYGLHDGYVIGNTGRTWAQRTGKSFEELLKIVWTDVHEHSQQHNWLPILYGFTDEPRVLEQANSELELMRTYKKAAPFVMIGGSYSVHWDRDSELDKAIQEIFKTLDWSALNVHSQTDIDKAKEFGKELWIYNQGRSRFSFGAYQWAEMHKGVKGRMQWHTQALHGYQFFDLDGREPDTSMVMWGRDQLYPTIHLPRCREGADDFRYAVTLWNLAQKNQDKPAAQAAIKWLQEVSDAIPAGGRNTVPQSLRDPEAFRNLCIEHLQKLMQ